MDFAGPRSNSCSSARWTREQRAVLAQASGKKVTHDWNVKFEQCTRKNRRGGLAANFDSSLPPTHTQHLVARGVRRARRFSESPRNRKLSGRRAWAARRGQQQQLTVDYRREIQQRSKEGLCARSARKRRKERRREPAEDGFDRRDYNCIADGQGADNFSTLTSLFDFDFTFRWHFTVTVQVTSAGDVQGPKKLRLDPRPIPVESSTLRYRLGSW